MDDNDLVKHLQKGSTKALEELIDRYGRYVSSILSRILQGRPEDCKELSADVFIAAWNNRQKLRPDKLKGYLGAIARNKAFNKLRYEHEELPLEEDILVFEDDEPCEAVERKDTALLVNRVLGQLEPRMRELFLRHYYYGQKLAEAAEEMGITLSAAKVWLHRGRAALREILRKEGYEHEGTENIRADG
ncbi:MAG: RNA polymerase sigma factor [Oscillospiraceae bacterium]|nr:RNA polymerase sigma factor [Oscillospiraceae bacterium]